jgi:hypothetical protein
MDGVKSEPRLGQDWGEEDEQACVNECCSPVNRTEVTLDGRGGGDPILPRRSPPVLAGIKGP